MMANSKSANSGGNRQMVRSRSSDNLPTSQSQMNIQMMSHTLTIREVRNWRLYFFGGGYHLIQEERGYWAAALMRISRNMPDVFVLIKNNTFPVVCEIIN